MRKITQEEFKLKYYLVAQTEQREELENIFGASEDVGRVVFLVLHIHQWGKELYFQCCGD